MKCLGITSRSVRIDFSVPRGIIISRDIDNWVKKNLMGKPVICVGDVVTETLVKNGIKPVVAVVDYKTRRSSYSFEGIKAYLTGYEYIRITNPPGKISTEAVHVICKLLSFTRRGRRFIIEVRGEEDMLALPIISCAPLGYTVIYGVPGVGMAVVNITEETRYIASQRMMYLEPVDCV